VFCISASFIQVRASESFDFSYVWRNLSVKSPESPQKHLENKYTLEVLDKQVSSSLEKVVVQLDCTLDTDHQVFSAGSSRANGAEHRLHHRSRTLENHRRLHGTT